MAKVAVNALDSFHLNGHGMVHQGEQGVEIDETLAKKLVDKGLVQLTGSASKRKSKVAEDGEGDKTPAPITGKNIASAPTNKNAGAATKNKGKK